MTRVLMISGQSMFAQGLDALLCQEAELEIVGHETDSDRAVERIKELVPDVVIFEDEGAELDLEPAMMRILKEGAGITVVGLSLQDNTIHIYRGEHRIIQEVEGLVEAIKTRGAGSEPASTDSGSSPASSAPWPAR